MRLLTGTVARPVVERAAATLAAAAGVPVRPFVVENELFGPHVTVTGLLGGAEVLEALRRDPLADGEWLARAAHVAAGRTSAARWTTSPRRSLRPPAAAVCVVAESLGDAFARLSR